MKLRTLLWRGFRLRCPYCGRGKMFSYWLKMNKACPHCQASFQRESGFYIGSIYFNYGLTSIIVAFAYPLLLFGGGFDNQQVLLLATAFVLLFPVWFFPIARSLWLGFDQYFDPRPVSEKKTGNNGEGQDRAKKSD